MRVNITLEHKESGERLYLTQKNKRNNPDRLELKKYSPNFVNTLFLKKLNKYSLDINCCPKIDFRAILEIFNFKV
ncbi:50S ribosomal protein L33 [Lactococcus garvieae TRF1]|uniref:Large ribosomal subunit protein bL33 n=1 Tax=Lactococcus garvieae TRF1 TaxID=1380772 RepID=V8APS3_9LACT|nr:50S ribosomal protein L33 [Lactococcus garvieae TRF1]